MNNQKVQISEYTQYTYQPDMGFNGLVPTLDHKLFGHSVPSKKQYPDQLEQ